MSEIHEHAGKNVVSAEQLEKMKEDLEYLLTTRTNEVVEAIKVARDFGDLSENAEYDAAREEQRQLQMQIEALRSEIENAEVVDYTNAGTDSVNIGTSVRILYMDDDETEEYSIVGSRDSDPMENKISNECPIGAALLGHKVGDVVTVNAPQGCYDIKILEIFR